MLLYYTLKLINFPHLIALYNVREDCGIVDVPDDGVLLGICLQVCCRKATQARIIGKLDFEIIDHCVRILGWSFGASECLSNQHIKALFEYLSCAFPH